MCSGRVDLGFILRAFENGQDGVFVGGCRLDECNYVTHGNYDALSNVYLFRKIMETIGLNPERLKIEFMSGADGNLLAEMIDGFTQKVKALGPLGKGEGIDAKEVKFKLEAVKKLIPYMKLVEREKLRVPFKSKEAYTSFFESGELDKLFSELFDDKLAISQIMLLLGEKPLSTRDIAEKLNLDPSDVSRHIGRSSQHGLVRYDESQKCYALAS
jgi:coenzyme F420-reducing hydrogenase delta subunit